MKWFASIVLWAAMAPAAYCASIHGIVTNGTTGQPQAGVTVTLLKLEQGMVEIGKATSDTAGRFSIEAPPPAANIPYLVRGTYQEVAYHAGARDAAADVHVQVYEKTLDRNAVHWVAEQVIVEPRPGRLMVAEVYTLQNNTQKTLAASGADKDTFHFVAAKGTVSSLTMAISGPSQMPLRQVATEHDDGSYGVEFPIRPGETKVEVSYQLPYSGSFNFEKPAAKSLVGGKPDVTVIAPMNGVTLFGAGLTKSRDEAAQGATFYAWTSNKPLAFALNGTLPEDPAAAGAGGSQVSAPPGGASANGRDAPPPLAGQASQEDIATMENQNFVFQLRWKILIVLGTALALGLAYLYRGK